MRLAVLTDIHGNLPALEAVLDDVAKQQVDEIMVAGDIVNILPFSYECWHRVMHLGCPVIQGNNEFYVYSYGTSEAPAVFEKPRFQSLRYTVSLFSEAERHAMRALPTAYRQEDLLIVHASARNLFDSLQADTPVDTVRSYFPDVRERFIFRGHNHRWYEHRWEDTQLVTICSLGLPFDNGLEAPYAILTRTSAGWDYEKRAVAYDQQALLDAMGAEYIHHHGALGHLHRLSVQTRSNHLMQFLADYLEPIDDGSLSIDDAVQRYITNLG